MPADERLQLGSSHPQSSRSQAFDAITRCYANSIGADVAALLTRREGKTRVVAQFARDDDRDPSIRWTGSSLLGQAFAADGPVVEERATENGNRSIGAVAGPVRSHQGLLGALYARMDGPHSAGEDELLWTTEAYARLAALAIMKDPAIATVFGLAGFDFLTGCLNPAGLTETLSSEIRRSQRSKHQLSCCFVDLDDFKLVNDQEGHVAGNRVLAAVGGALLERVRGSDVVCRFGGDEFVVVLPETGGRAAAAAARRMRAGIGEAIADATAVEIDVSIGVAEWDGESTASALLEAADEALREAKRSGGSRIVSSNSAASRANGLLELTKELVGNRRASGARHDGGDSGAG
jgi:diguanylate cyclase (GGDEF)-like protein